MISNFGSEEFNFSFHFATNTSPSSEQEKPTTRNIERENKLRLLGFPDEAVNGWEITPLFKPTEVSNVVCFCVWHGWVYV